MAWVGSIFAFLAGALATVQAGNNNSQLKQGFGTPMPALLVNYVLGFTAVLTSAHHPHRCRLRFQLGPGRHAEAQRLPWRLLYEDLAQIVTMVPIT